MRVIPRYLLYASLVGNLCTGAVIAFLLLEGCRSSSSLDVWSEYHIHPDNKASRFGACEQEDLPNKTCK